jgi:carbon-monoxide dehydrogenase small subunit
MRNERSTAGTTSFRILNDQGPGGARVIKVSFGILNVFDPRAGPSLCSVETAMQHELDRPVQREIISLKVNGEAHELLVPVHETLLEVLRERLGLTGTKHGCELGECGTCTVLVGGRPQLSCLVLPIQVGDAEVTTVEGMGSTADLHPLQQAFLELGAAQCGYCTPGMLLSARALLDRRPRPDREEIREALAGNLCRCTGYSKIVEAVELAASRSAP